MQAGRSGKRIQSFEIKLDDQLDDGQLEAQALAAAGIDIGNDLEQEKEEKFIQQPTEDDSLLQLRIPVNSFLQNEIRFENAQKFQPIFMEAFIIFAIVWSFGSVLTDHWKKELDVRLKAKIDPLSTDFVQFQKWKKKNATTNRTTPGGTSRGSKIVSPRFTQNVSNNGQKSNRDTVLNICLTEEFTTSHQDYQPPKFISEIHHEQTLFDYHFNLDLTTWQRFSVEKELNNAIVAYHHLPQSLKRVNSLFVPTIETTKYCYLIECLVTTQRPTLLVGAHYSGKSQVLRQCLLDQVYQYSDKTVTEHMIFSKATNTHQLKEMLEQRLILEIGEAVQSKHRDARIILKPESGRHVLFFIDDLSMPDRDTSGSQPVLEVLRDYLSTGGWHQKDGQQFRRVMNETIFATLTIPEQGNHQISNRLLHHFTVIGFDQVSRETVKAIFKVYSDIVVMRWGAGLQSLGRLLCDSLIDLQDRLSDLDILKPTPTRSHYQFCWLDLMKICGGLNLIESSYLRDIRSLARLMYHELLRVVCDKVSLREEQEQVSQLLRDFCSAHFDSHHHTQVDHSLPNEIYFSFYNPEVEGFYTEIEGVESVTEVIERHLQKYNDSPGRQPLNLIVIKEINKVLMKVVRTLSTSHGNLLIIALKGSGISTVIRLACFSQQLHLSELQAPSKEFGRPEWLQELKSLMTIAGQDDKSIVYSVDQFSLPQAQSEMSFFNDLQCIVNNQFHSEVFSQTDLDAILLSIHEQIEVLKPRHLRHKHDKGPNDSCSPKGKKEGVEGAKPVNPLLKHESLRSQAYINFLSRIKHHFRLCFTLSPTGDSYQDHVSYLKQSYLLASCTVIWVPELARESLIELAYKHFMNVYIDEERARIHAQREAKLRRDATINDKDIDVRDVHVDDITTKIRADALDRLRESPPNKIIDCCIQMYTDARYISQKYHSTQKQTLYFTLTHFLDVFSNYRRLFVERQKSITETKKRYETGLKRIIDAQNSIVTSFDHLELQTPELQERQEELVEIATKIEYKFSQIQVQRDLLRRDEFILQKELESATAIREECDQQLSKVIPALNEAVSSIKAIPRHDISEIKAMKKPPKIIRLILKALCILLEIQPIVKRCRDGITYKPSYWLAAQSKDLLGNPTLTQFLIDFDRSKITIELMQRVETEVISHPDYSFENAYNASKAAPELFDWVLAVRDYFYVFREIAPRRDAYMMAEIQYKQKKEEFELKKKELTEIEDEVNSLRKQQSVLEMRVDMLRGDLKDCRERKRRADILMKSLAGEKQKWVVCSRMLSGRSQNVAGDVILAAAYITFLTGFTKKYRDKLLAKWIEQLLQAGFHTSSTEKFSLVTLFGDSPEVRAWTSISGLPNDELSLSNAIVMDKTSKYSVCIDPQLQANIWLKKQFKEEGLIITKQTDHNFIRFIEQAIEEGKPLLVQNVTEDLMPQLIELLKKDNVSRHSWGDKLVHYRKKVYRSIPTFSIYFTTTIERPHFEINIQNCCTVINFEMTVDSLLQQLLTMIVGAEKKELEDRFTENSKEAYEDSKQLKQIENAILELLKMGAQVLLQDDVLIKTLDSSRATEEKIASKLKTIESTSATMTKAREAYTPVARRAAVMYFVVIEMHKIAPMFRFSLAHFLKIFGKALQHANKVQGKSIQLLNVASNNDKQINRATSAAKKNFETAIKLKQDEHINSLSHFFMSDLYRKVIAAFLPKDRLLFTYQMIFRMLEAEGLLEKSPLFKFLIDSEIQIETTPQPLEAPTWITRDKWIMLQKLQTQLPFTKANVSEHILHNNTEWTSFYGKESYEVSSMPNHHLLRPVDASQQLAVKTPFMKNILQIKILATKAADSSQPGTPLPVKQEDVNDEEDIWKVSDSENDQESNSSNSQLQLFQKVKKGVLPKASDKLMRSLASNKMNDYLKEQMALYLLQQNPLIIYTPADNIEEKMNQDKAEQEKQVKKKLVEKNLTLLCLLKCIRPEVVGTHIVKLLSPIVNLMKILEPSIQNDKLTLQNQLTYFIPENTQQLGFTLPKKMFSHITSSNEIKMLKDACDEANHFTPIFLILNGQINVHATIIDFQRAFQEYQTVRVQYFSMGKGQERKIEEKILHSSSAGDWLIIENLNLSLNWIPRLEDMIAKLQAKTEGVSSRFRLWIMSTPLPNCSENILYNSVKVQLLPLSGHKHVMERLINRQSHEIFQHSAYENRHLHKNIFFSMMYLHSAINGRKRFGVQGWSLPYEFDNGDFEIAVNQLSKIVNLQSDSPDKALQIQEESIQFIRCLLGQVQYGAKIYCLNDLQILTSLIENLFQKELLFKKEVAAPSMHDSHYGFPELDFTTFVSYKEYILKFPENDSEYLFGFNENIDNHLRANQMLRILDDVNVLHRKTQQVFKNPLDLNVKDQNDIKVIENSQVLLKQLTPFTKFFSTYQSLPQYKEVNSTPFTNFIKRELSLYATLLQYISDQLQSMINDVNGMGMPINEQLWLAILQDGALPQEWLQKSYSTCKCSISGYISELQRRLQFIKSLYGQSMQGSDDILQRPIWFSGIFDQKQFLITLRQLRAKDEGTAIEKVYLRLEVTTYRSRIKVIPRSEDTSIAAYLTGFWLQGAQWDLLNEELQESHSYEQYTEFPIVKVITSLEIKKPDPLHYSCPIFKSHRENLSSNDTGLIDFIDIKSSESPNKWAKRSVALFLEAP